MLTKRSDRTSVCRSSAILSVALHLVEYGRTNEGEAAANWQRSAFYHLLVTGGDELRRRLGLGEPTDFHQLDQMKAEGHTDYLALVHRFSSEGAIGEMDCVYSHWATRHQDGFRDHDLVALRRLVPALALAVKCEYSRKPRARIDVPQ